MKASAVWAMPTTSRFLAALQTAMAIISGAADDRISNQDGSGNRHQSLQPKIAARSPRRNDECSGDPGELHKREFVVPQQAMDVRKGEKPHRRLRNRSVEADLGDSDSRKRDRKFAVFRRAEDCGGYFYGCETAQKGCPLRDRYPGDFAEVGLRRLRVSQRRSKKTPRC